MTKVDVVPDFEEDGIYAITSPDEVDAAELNAVFGCDACGALLTVETSSTPCPGPDDE